MLNRLKLIWELHKIARSKHIGLRTYYTCIKVGEALAEVMGKYDTYCYRTHLPKDKMCGSIFNRNLTKQERKDARQKALFDYSIEVLRYGVGIGG